MPKISVIVPIYNAEKYLRRCLESLRKQTFLDYEVVLVDDGSKDRSLQICKEYENKDKHFKVIHKDNGGVSSARQFGIEHAQGEYTIHCDPDDWVKPEMLEKLYKKAQETNADMVICDYYIVNQYGHFVKKQRPDSTMAHDVLYDILHGKLHGSTWNKLIRRSCYQTYNVSFPKDINYCEDVLANVLILMHPVKIVYLNEAFYYYDRTIMDSLVFHYDRQTLQMDMRLISELGRITSGTEYYQDALCFACCQAAIRALRSGKLSGAEYRKSFRDKLDFINSSSIIGMPKKSLINLGVFFSYKMASSMFNVLKRYSIKKGVK